MQAGNSYVRRGTERRRRPSKSLGALVVVAVALCVSSGVAGYELGLHARGPRCSYLSEAASTYLVCD